MMSKIAKWFLFMILINILIQSQVVEGSIIKGSIYDPELNIINNAVVKINTTPKQTLVTTNGTYFFDVEPGTYILESYSMENGITLKTTETVVVKKNDGIYTLDLILIPELDINISNPINEKDLNIILEKNEKNDLLTEIVALVILILGITITLYFIMRKKGKSIIEKKEKPSEEEIDEDEKFVLKLLYKNDKRMTQKEIRKEMHYSDAKISLMLDVMVKKGLVEKYKKGRQNIIVLKAVDLAKELVEKEDK